MRLKLKSITGYISLSALMLILLSYLFFSFANTPYPVSIVDGKSMEPTLQEGDMVFWLPAKMDDVHVGDIIIYKSYVYEDKIICHRVVDIKEYGNAIYFETKGDDNNYTDQRGSHAPERYVGADHFLGKVSSSDGNIIKIPSTLNIFFSIPNFFSSFINEPTTTHYYVVSLVSIITCAVVFIILRTHKPRKKNREEWVFGREKQSIAGMFIFILIVYMVFSLATAQLFYTSEQAAVNVNMGEEPSADVSFGDIKDGDSSSRNASFTNPSLIPTRSIIFSSGSISKYMGIEKPSLYLGPNQMKEETITVSVPNGTQKGVYDGEIYMYSSPFWLIFPEGFTGYLVKTNPGLGMVTIHILSGIIWSAIFTGLLFLTGRLIEKHELYETRKSLTRVISSEPKTSYLSLKKCYTWLSNTDWVEVRPSKPVTAALISLIFLPIVFIGRPFLAILLCAFFSGILTYVLGCKWRGGIMLSGIVSTSILLGFLLILFVSSFPYHNFYLFSGALTYIIGIFMIILLLCLLPVCFFSYMGAYITNLICERRNPAIILKGDTDL